MKSEIGAAQAVLKDVRKVFPQLAAQSREAKAAAKPAPAPKRIRGKAAAAK